jgi:hypothetical protein
MKCGAEDDQTLGIQRDVLSAFTLFMEAVGNSETSVNFHATART